MQLREVIVRMARQREWVWPLRQYDTAIAARGGEQYATHLQTST